ncbi:acetyl-CoA carboxylase biotin carboxylase subunit [Ktedonosporobacter rubrisoli]|uniref:biotin carboxylase n=1 Tax=Ktedonosporobacter rubrisoli TaxID=2509675 RepID=A0A4P6JYL3_KTERU|nr:acetyl-CoA carboxylase biotin carboxylase subunit [Ktedonosporobacter rubrisoli]QBD80136.1 acetyl-CoA carboxylase biotin carboxylase subunit [Ktedonosporobacter rubrisoli]
MNSSSVVNWPFRKVLIANRGEIAIRIIRACRELGLSSVAVYSDVDRHALHVRMADEAYHIGPAVAAQSYLNIPKLIEVARRSGAQAVHPGYGFLAENATFVEACKEAGLIFVGPPAEAQLAMGEKTAARRTAKAAGVPIVPGAMTDVEDDAQAHEIAEGLGYPILLKAAAGGGGKGIRFVRNPEDLLPSLRTARSEARSAFGDGRVYLEKAIAPARHIEVQFIADTHGNVVHLGERECSIQRRHQKLIEESPSPVVDPELRARMTTAAVNLIRSINYVNAGTAEFLLGPEGNFYFLEVNARIQVEHPVTEWCTGFDLVQEQFRVAAGLPLSFSQDDVQLRGSAIECRISAEDPANRFLPATGTVQALQEPSGPGIRVDSSLYPGLQVPLFYDPLLSKLIVWGKDRAQAIARMRRALDEYHIVGVRTTLPFARWLMEHPRFAAADMSTDFIAEEWDGSARALLPGEPSEAPTDLDNHAKEELSVEQVAAIVGSILTHTQMEEEKQHRQLSSNGHEEVSRWRAAGRKEALRIW